MKMSLVYPQPVGTTGSVSMIGTLKYSHVFTC